MEKASAEGQVLGAYFGAGRRYRALDLSLVVQSLSRVRLFVTPWTAARQAPLFFTISWSLLTFMSLESEMPSNHLIPCCPLLLLASIFPSIRVFFNESTLLIRWPNTLRKSYFSRRSSGDPENLIPDRGIRIPYGTAWSKRKKR